MSVKSEKCLSDRTFSNKINYEYDLELLLKLKTVKNFVICWYML